MRKIKYILQTGMALCCMAASYFPARAQEAQKEDLQNPATIELIKAKALWFHTPNAAGLVMDRMHDFNQVSGYYHLKNGDYKKQQEGEYEREIGFNTEGALELGGAMLWGSFSYSNEMRKRSRFNTALLDPFRNIPYYISDPVVSDWTRQTYDLRVKAATPWLWNRIVLGVEGSYTTQSGAKQMDPRSDKTFYTLSVRPGILVKLTEEHAFGLHFAYQVLNEDGRLTRSNNQLNYTVYLMNGLGNNIPDIVGSFGISPYLYEANMLGGGFQYGFSGVIKVVASGSYEHKVEDVNTIPDNKIKRVGSTRQNKYEVKIQVATTETNLHRFMLQGVLDNLDGIEYVQEFNNDVNVQKWIVLAKNVRSNYKTKHMDFAYDFFKTDGADYRWTAGLTANYYNTEQIYYMPKSTLDAENIAVGLHAKYNFHLGEAVRLLAGINGGYNKNLSGEYIYGGAEPTSVVITEFMRPDFEFLVSDYYHIGAEFTFSHGIGKKGNGLFGKVSVHYYKPTDGDDIRLLSGISVGLTF